MKNQYLKFGIFKNKYLVGAFVLGAALQVVVACIPTLADIFKLVSLNTTGWLYTIGISISPLIIIEIQKKFNDFKFGKVIYNHKSVKEI